MAEPHQEIGFPPRAPAYQKSPLPSLRAGSTIERQCIIAEKSGSLRSGTPLPRLGGWVEKYLTVQWWQWVFFTEVGRVAPSWTFDTLHKNMKFDAGVGVRAMIKGLVLRIDVAGSSESWGVNMMVAQPFQW